GRMECAVSFPAEALQKTPWYIDIRWLLPAILLSLAIMFLTLILWPIAAMVRKHYGRQLEISRGSRRSRLAVNLVCALDLIFVLVFLVFLIYASEHLELLSARSDLWLHLLQVVGAVGAIGTIMVAFNTIRAWFTAERRVWYKLYATILLLACLAVVWFEMSGRLLSFSMKY
ncbi:MAG TPA: hypothetical protein VLZ81_04035, partial [Blastocatellia bacterium]|nr:hypothetical protein [Blastocatellia bacterium]